MDDLTKQKIAMWEKKLEELNARLVETKLERGEAAQMGDLRENGAYQTLTEEAEVLSARINDIEKILKTLRGGEDKKGNFKKAA